MSALAFHPLTADRWPDLEDLFGKDKGANSGCWCMWPRVSRAEFDEMGKDKRKRAEEALLESDKRFQALLDNSPNLIFIKDVEGRYLVVGFASGSIPALPVNLALLKNASLLGVEIRHLLSRDPAKARRVRRSLFSMVRAGHLKAPAVVTFPLDRSRDAVLATASRDRIGKVVVVPSSI